MFQIRKILQNCTLFWLGHLKRGKNSIHTTTLFTLGCNPEQFVLEVGHSTSCCFKAFHEEFCILTVLLPLELLLGWLSSENQLQQERRT